jgi:hypothetical protein
MKQSERNLFPTIQEQCWGFHGVIVEKGGFLDCCAAWLSNVFLTFPRKVLPYSSVLWEIRPLIKLKMKEENSFKQLESNYPRKNNLENLLSQNQKGFAASLWPTKNLSQVQDFILLQFLAPYIIRTPNSEDSVQFFPRFFTSRSAAICWWCMKVRSCSKVFDEVLVNDWEVGFHPRKYRSAFRISCSLSLHSSHFVITWYKNKVKIKSFSFFLVLQENLWI